MDPLHTERFYQTMHELKGSLWGREASELAREAATVLKTTPRGDAVKVLDIGCGDGRDTLFFAMQGWHVTAVDASPQALALLEARAREHGVDAQVRTLCADFASLPLDDGEFDLVFANYSLHYLEPEQRRAFFAKVQKATKERGLHALLALTDLNEEFLGRLEDYRYFGAGELAALYAPWKIVDHYEGPVPDDHPGVGPHEHVVTVLMAEKGPGAGERRRWPAPLRSALLAAFFASLSVVLCTLGYNSLAIGQIADVWPGAIFQALASVTLGGWGVLGATLAGVVTNAINVKTAFAVLGFIPANLVQSALPAWYWRRQLRNGGWNKRALEFWRFALFAVVLPNLAGAALGALPIHVSTGAPFFAAMQQWALANIPIALVLGGPLFLTLAPCLVREGWAVKGWWR